MVADSSRADEAEGDARTLFAEGLAAADAGDWSHALDRFREALRLQPSPVIAYNLGVALSELGLHAEAATVLQRVQEHAEARASTRENASRLLRVLEEKVATLRLHVVGSNEHASVRVDERPVALGPPIYLEPGSHELIVERDGSTLSSRRLSLGAGESRELSLALLPEVSSPPRMPLVNSASSFAAHTRPDAARSRIDARPSRAPWIPIGVGSAALAASLTLAIAGRSAERAAEEARWTPGSPTSYSEARRTADRAQTYFVTSGICLAMGLVAVGVGMLWKKREQRPARRPVVAHISQRVVDRTAIE